MSVLLYLIPAALLLGLMGLCAFLWAMRTNQFGDLDGAAERILYDDDSPAAGKPSAHHGARALSAQGPSRPLPPLSMHRRRGRRRRRARTLAVHQAGMRNCLASIKPWRW